MARALRVDLGRLTDAAARGALGRYRRLIESATRRYHDRDDARAIARYAVLEAYARAFPQEPEPGLVRGCVRWRLSEHLREVLRAERPHREADAELRVASAPGDEPHEGRQAQVQLELSVTYLSPRQRAVVAGVLRGESQTRLARRLGLSPAEVSRSLQSARRILARDEPRPIVRIPGRSGTGPRRRW